MTAQQIFDQVATHLLTQKEPSLAEDKKTCLYYAPDGKKCAVGCLIKDEYYTKGLEYYSVNAVSVEEAVRQSLGLTKEDFTPELEALLLSLQRVHDYGAYLTSGNVFDFWKKELDCVAYQHNLLFVVNN